MLSDKALLNTLMIFTKMEFLRDIQYNPFNSAKIIHFFLFSLWETKYILDEAPQDYKPLVVDTKNIILEYPKNYDDRGDPFDIIGNFIDRIAYTLAKFIDGKRSLPLILGAFYCEREGFSFSEVYKSFLAIYFRNISIYYILNQFFF